ncbi:MAG: TrmH family RNA methyltransferase [Candidatus Rifleibacteriota bacterium]
MPTRRRIYRVANAIHKRQLDLAIALENVHDQHNISAVLRTADATGIGKVYWQPDWRKPESVNPEVSKGAEKWVDLEVVDNLKERMQKIKKQGFKIAATHMGREAVDFRKVDWTQPWVVIMGNEQRGCSDEILEICDTNIFLPMAGFVQSLNISVASAVTMYEIQRQRELAGLYSKKQDESQVKKLFTKWKLDEQKFSLQEVITPPDGEMPDNELPHSDGRAVRKCPEIKRY